MRYAAIVEYDGTEFHGWQAQNNGVRNVQHVLEKALAVVANEEIKVICAGRTDKGVHATGQVVHFDSSAQRSSRSWVLGVNTHLPEDVSLRWIGEVHADFHARFDAVERSYRYLIIQSNVKPAMLRNGVAWDYRDLDVSRMQAAANALIGKHDFNAFRAAFCQSHSAVRTMKAIKLERCNQVITMDITANAFLHHMVRNIMGTLQEVGCGDRTVESMAKILASQDRKMAGKTAPASGLYLTKVAYPEKFCIPQNDCVPSMHWNETKPFEKTC